MNLLFATFLALIVWLVIGKLIIPKFKEMNFRKSKFAELTKVGWIAALGYIKKFSLYAAITYAGIWIFLKTINLLAFFFKSSDGIIEAFFNLLTGIYERLNVINDKKFIVVLLILSVIFIVLITQNARKYARSIYDKLSKDYQEGKLPRLEPSIEMEEVNKNISDFEEEFESIAAIPPGSLELQDQEKQAYYLEYFKQIIPALKFHWQDLDIRRRIIPELEKEDDTKKKKGSRWAKLITFFTSKGLVKSLYNTSKTLGTLGLVFILLSFLGASKSLIKNDTNEVVLKITNLDLQNQQKNINEKWQETLSQEVIAQPEEEDLEWDDEDEKTLDEISRHFELAIANSITSSLKPTSQADNFRLRANAVKEQAIKTFATSAEGTVKPGYEILEQGSRLTDIEPELNLSKKYSQVYSRNINKSEPTTSIGKQFRQNLKQKVQSNKGIWNSVKSNYQSSLKAFSTSATPKEVLGMILGESFEELVSGTGKLIESGSFEGKILEDMVGRTGNKTAKTWIDVKMNQFTDDLVHMQYGEALDNVIKTKTPAEKFMSYAVKDLDFPTVERVGENLSQHPPSLDYQPLSRKEISDSKIAIRKLSNQIPNRRAVFADAITDYKYYFPGQAGMEAESAAAEFLIENAVGSASNGNSPRKPSTSSKPKTGTAKGKIASNLPAGRARSFKALRGFRRIGGVLIGQDPSNTGNTEVDFRDITWKDLGNKMEIFLHRSDGEVISTGIYDKDIINQAIAYVADGRLITVTMVNGGPLLKFYDNDSNLISMLKILVHPALVDTDLGCKAIRLDRLVDIYASGRNNEKVKFASKSFSYQNFLYKWVAYLNMRETPSNNYNELELGELDKIIDNYTNSIVDNWIDIYDVLKKGEVLNTSTTSHLVSKPEYYNKEIVSLIKSSIIKSKGNFDEFFNLIKNQKIPSSEPFIKADTEIWSGVRELPYQVDNELSFLGPTEDYNSNLYPLSFIRQIVFSPIEHTDDEYNDIEQVDEDPWGFPELKKEGIIENLVWEGVSHDTSGSDLVVLNQMKTFTNIQRIFRVAMNGDLGYDFPVEKLAELAKQTSSYINYTPTPTWNSSRFQWDQFQQRSLYAEIPDLVNDLKSLWFSQGIEDKKNQNPCN
ncbi:hypothetical protein AAGF08_20090 [Algoriphagus sp. SE2]|uniref:hypothetical protein n=1 Tax=Algoriphagus sp. SE2 TaxID=3141536 RepID=UPI0031CD5BA7